MVLPSDPGVLFQMTLHLPNRREPSGAFVCVRMGKKTENKMEADEKWYPQGCEGERLKQKRDFPQKASLEQFEFQNMTFYHV